MLEGKVRLWYTGSDEIKGVLSNALEKASRRINFASSTLDEHIYIGGISTSGRMLNLFLQGGSCNIVILHMKEFKGSDFEKMKQISGFVGRKNVCVVGPSESAPLYLGRYVGYYGHLNQAENYEGLVQVFSEHFSRVFGLNGKSDNGCDVRHYTPSSPNYFQRIRKQKPKKPKSCLKESARRIGNRRKFRKREANGCSEF